MTSIQNNMNLSVVVPTKNRPTELRTFLKSLYVISISPPKKRGRKAPFKFNKLKKITVVCNFRYSTHTIRNLVSLHRLFYQSLEFQALY